MRVRIWNSGYLLKDGSFIRSSVPYTMIKGFVPGRVPNVGHVSVETKGFYASLWPATGLTILNKLQVHDGENSTIKNDIEVEGHPPNHLIDLYSLDINTITKVMEKYVIDSTKKSNGVYNLMGVAANSCSTLAYGLLISGGIRKNF